MREQGFIDLAQERDGQARGRFASGPTAAKARRGTVTRKDYLRQRFRDQFGGDHPPDWRVDTTFVARAPGRRRDGGDARARPPRIAGAPGGAGRHRSAPPATCWPWSAAATSRSRAFNRASRSRRQPGSAFKPFVFAAALERGMSPVSELRGLDRLPPQGPDEWTPRNVGDDAPDVLTLRAALIESNNRAAVAAAAADGQHARYSAWRRARGCDDLPDVPSLALGTGLVTPLAS